MQKIEHVLYINLESRLDRKVHVEQQLKNIGITNAERFNAIKLENGRAGCSMSHLKCLMLAKKNKWPHVMICEDDILFLDPPLFKKNLDAFLSNMNTLGSLTNPLWDVLLIAGNNCPPYYPICDEYIKVTRCQTTTGYLVLEHYYDTLIENIKTGMNLLLKNKDDHFHYAIDKYWLELQGRDRWYLIIPLTVVQREDYSDIEKRFTNYAALMTDLDKRNFLKNYLKKLV
jgi:GR25 family glycosyltransferase involved in LPS biosynthesis